MLSPNSLPARPPEAGFTPPAALSHLPLGSPNEKYESNPFDARSLLLSVFYRDPANPSERPAPNPFSAPPGVSNPRGIIQFRYHSIPEVKATRSEERRVAKQCRSWW